MCCLSISRAGLGNSPRPWFSLDCAITCRAKNLPIISCKGVQQQRPEKKEEASNQTCKLTKATMHSLPEDHREEISGGWGSAHSVFRMVLSAWLMEPHHRAGWWQMYPEKPVCLIPRTDLVPQITSTWLPFGPTSRNTGSPSSGMPQRMIQWSSDPIISFL